MFYENCFLSILTSHSYNILMVPAFYFIHSTHVNTLNMHPIRYTIKTSGYFCIFFISSISLVAWNNWKCCRACIIIPFQILPDFPGFSLRRYQSVCTVDFRAFRVSFTTVPPPMDFRSLFKRRIIWDLTPKWECTIVRLYFSMQFCLTQPFVQ